MFFPVYLNFSVVLISLSDAVNIVQPKSTYKTNLTCKGKGKVNPLQARCGLEGG